jgi:hypothetical protein
MKCKVSAANLKTLVKTVTSIYDYARVSSEANNLGVLSVEDDGLWIEYGSAGAYIRKRAEAKILRKGKVGIDLQMLKKYRLAGEITLNSPKNDSTLTVEMGKRTRYQLPTDQEASEEIEAFRPDPVGRSKPQVRLPIHMLKFATNCITYKPGKSDDKIKIQARFRKIGKKKPKGSFILSGNDPFSFARYVTKSPKIRVRKGLDFILSSQLLQQVMSELDPKGELQLWGVEGGDEETSKVRFVSEGFDFCHPILASEEFDDISEQSKMVQSGRCSGQFVSSHQAVKIAFDDVNVLGSSQDPAIVHIRVSKKNGVVFGVHTTNHKARAVLDDTEDVKARKAFVIPVHGNYLGEFLRAFPSSLPIRVEKWDNTIRLVAENIEEGVIEYVATQGGSDD